VHKVLEASQHWTVPLQCEPLAPQTTPQILRGIQDIIATNEELTLDGILPPAGDGDPSPQFVLNLGPAANGNKFDLTSNDASTLLRLLMPDSRTQGGRLTFAGAIDVEASGLPFAGDLAVSSFKLTRSPLLARLLMLSSMSGILSTFQGEGLSIDTMTAGINTATGKALLEAAIRKQQAADFPRPLFSADTAQ
jgi:hypothetical protein